ncbi:MAG: fimbrillin family protein [Bacteroidales bacterium]|nr:fimbrillin family protein [Bacteroidales bacterium]
MKRIIYSFSMMAALFCFASCNEKMNLEQPDVTNKITVTTQVDPHTKAGYETSENVTVLPDKFYIEIDQDGTDLDYRVPLTREPNTNNYQSTIELQWKSSDNANTKVKALTIPYGLTSVDMENPMVISIHQEQNNSDNLKASDLIGASTGIGGIEIIDNNINVAFRHLMSKLQITYTKPDDIQINSVQLKNTCVKGGYSYASMAYDSSIAAEFGDITMYHEVEKKSAEAIFFPYTPTSDPKLVVNATINGQTKAFECPIVLKQSSAFVGGKRYIMTVTVSETGIEGVVTMIKDWNSSSSQVAGERVLWIGTSIPAGAGAAKSYPALVDDAMNCTIVNNAVGGSVVLEAPSTYTFEVGTWNYLYAGGLSQTHAEAESIIKPKLEAAAAAYETTDAIREQWVTEQLAIVKSLSYESLIIPYIDGTLDNCTTVIIDHDFNDITRLVLEAQPFGSYPGYENSNSETEWGYNFLTALKEGNVTVDQYLTYLEPFWNNPQNVLTEEYSYILAMQKIINAIYAVDENIRIIIGNYFATDSPWVNWYHFGNGFDAYQLTKVLLYYNEAVAGIWDLDVVNVYEHLHIDESSFWAGYDSNNQVVIDESKFCPDGVHPYNSEAVQAIADVWISALNGVVGSVN